MSLKSYIYLAAAAALAAALFWGGNALYQAGYDARDAIAVRAQADELQRKVTEGQQQIQDARAADLKVAAQLAAEKAAAKTRAARLDTALAQQERTPFKPKDPTDETKPLLGQSVLDVFTLCLLNAERAGAVSPASACAPGRTDEEVRAAAATPSEVGGGDLARSDQEVARLYRELATRHDGLVDWVDTNVIKGAP